MTIRYVGWCLSGVRACSSPKLGKVLIAEGSLGVFLAWKPGRLGSDAYSTRRGDVGYYSWNKNSLDV